MDGLLYPVLIVASVMTSSLPSIETMPYVGNPPVDLCQHQINGATKAASEPVSGASGQVCRFAMPGSLGEGVHIIKARYQINGEWGPYSPPYYFRRYVGPSGANFWTYEGAVICDPDCVSK